MNVAFHIGAHCTDEDRLIKSLLKNREQLSKSGIIVPGPSRYRNLIRQTIQSLDGSVITIETQEALLDAIIDEDKVERLILSSENFLSFPNWIFGGQSLYTTAGERIQKLAGLFAGSETEFFLSIRNPATFIPAVYARTKDISFADYLRGVNPYTVSWAKIVAEIRQSNPDKRLVVWCNEDTPMIWTQLMQVITGADKQFAFEGQLDLLAEIMTREGLQRYISYLKTHPPQDDVQASRIITAFLDKFAVDEKVEEELDAPGWTFELVERITDQYELDIQRIAEMPDVELIEP